MTRRETFESIEDIWMKEVDMYSTVEDGVKMVVANKVDMVRSLYSCSLGDLHAGTCRCMQHFEAVAPEQLGMRTQ